MVGTKSLSVIAYLLSLNAWRQNRLNTQLLNAYKREMKNRKTTKLQLLRNTATGEQQSKKREISKQ